MLFRHQTRFQLSGLTFSKAEMDGQVCRKVVVVCQYSKSALIFFQFEFVELVLIVLTAQLPARTEQSTLTLCNIDLCFLLLEF